MILCPLLGTYRFFSAVPSSFFSVALHSPSFVAQVQRPFVLNYTLVHTILLHIHSYTRSSPVTYLRTSSLSSSPRKSIFYPSILPHVLPDQGKMRFLVQCAFAAVAALVGNTMALPLTVSPDPGALTITANNTVNATTPFTGQVAPTTSGLTLDLVNNLGESGVNCYITGSDSNGVLVMLQPNGEFFYPTCDGPTPQQITANVAIPLGGAGSTTKITIPSYISAARVWFAQGELTFFTVAGANGAPSLVEPSAVNPSDPSAAVSWGFVELTYTQAGGLFANISYVDFVGLVLGMSLSCLDGTTQTALGLQATAVASICSDLKAQEAVDGQPWGDLCVQSTSGTPLRVLSPQDYISLNPNAFADYYTSYVSSVWSHFASSTLTIDTQASAGNVACSVSGSALNCAGDNRGYAEPCAADIFGCNSGPFAIESGDNGVHVAVVPRLCAAFARSTLLVSGGNTQPGPDASEYYTQNPTNWYSKIVHEYEVDGKGYAFAYDDVTPDSGTNNAGVVASSIPGTLTITVGGPGGY